MSSCSNPARTTPRGSREPVELIELGGGIDKCRELAAEKTAEAQKRARELAECGVITTEAAELLVSMADFFINRRA